MRSVQERRGLWLVMWSVLNCGHEPHFDRVPATRASTRAEVNCSSIT